MEKLEQLFDIRPVEVIHVDGTSELIVPEGSEDEDHTYARARHYELAEKGSEALDIAMRIARESENPRAIEVLSGLIKNLSDVNKALLTINKDKADIKTAKTGRGSSSVGTAVQTQNNIIFSGSSKDLNKLIAEQMK
jgi:hypothetical protein